MKILGLLLRKPGVGLDAVADLQDLPTARGGFLDLRFIELQPFWLLEQLIRPELRAATRRAPVGA